jgi:glycosyltransferase involved in cell wall biosynthesis
MLEKKRVSIVIPVFNRPQQIKDAIMSVLLQSHKHIEIIIVDDGSTDETPTVITELSMLWPDTILVHKQQNSGPGAARQKGTELSRGDFIQYLDSDDILYHTKLEEQVNALHNQPQADICYGLSYQEDYGFHPPLLIGPMRDTGKEVPKLFPRLINERWWTTSSPLYRNELVKKVGPWKNYLNEEDWEFDARAGKEGVKLAWVPDIVSVRRIHRNEDHLSNHGYTDPRKLRDRIHAKRNIFECAIEAKVSPEGSEMYLFSRECFLLAKQCAEIGLYKEAESVFKLACEASVGPRRVGLDILVYGLLGQLIGWIRIGSITKWIRSVLK